jgi:hypothetical protein
MTDEQSPDRKNLDPEALTEEELEEALANAHISTELLAAAALWEQIQLHRQKAGLEPHDKRRLPPQFDPAFYRDWEYL